MNHFLEIIEIQKEGTTYYELYLHSGEGRELWTGSHSHARLQNMADHIAVIQAPHGIDKMVIIDNVGLSASVPLVESLAKMRNS